MNLIGIFILTALIFEFVLHRLSEALNLRSASAKVPDAFKDLYDSTRYARAQDYLRAHTRFAWISSGVFLARSIENIPAASRVSIETPDRERKN